MTARTVPISLSIIDTDGITAGLIAPGRVRIRLGADDASPWMYVSDVRVVDRLAGVLMDARRMLAPDDPAPLVQVVASGEPVAEAPGGAS